MGLRGFAVCLLGFCFLAVPAQAQSPMGTISGRVTDQSDASMPGVTVTAESPNLQGDRTAVSTSSGDFIIPLLPPGDYTVTFTLSGFQSVRRTVGVAGTQSVTLNEQMVVSGVSEEVNVVASAEPFTQTPQLATKFKQDFMATLPTNRSLQAAVLLSPTIHATGPAGNYSIAGATSFESTFTVNGVSVTENLRGQPIDLYIEDALQETTVASSGISAEYGRFSGGLVNAITKSGGNRFGGSYRQSFNNDNWRSTTPFNESKLDKLVPTYEYTFGGPVAKDRLWFFNAGRFQDQQTSQTTASTNAIPYVRTLDEKRYEGKLTYSPFAGHTIAGSYLRAEQAFKNFTQFNVLDLASLGTQAQKSNLVAGHYTGVWRSDVFAEAQYSRRTAALGAPGSTATDLIHGTLVQDLQRGFRYWSPTFCGACDPDHRDNDEVVLKSTYFWSAPHRGSHTIVAGYDRYHDHRQANNHQSGSDYRLLGTTSTVVGGIVYPILASEATAILYTPIAQNSTGTELITHSTFVNDEWHVNNRLSLNVGVRWDRNQGEDGSGGTVSDRSKFSPRLGAVVDPTGSGQWAVTASYSRYVAALNTSVAEVSPAGTPSVYQWIYTGPSINTDPTQPLVGTDVAIQQVFDWFNGRGGTNQPADGSQLPGINVKVNGSLDSPESKEYAAGVSRQIAGRGSVRADFLYRKYGDFYGIRTDLSTGRVTDSEGSVFDLGVVENTNIISRQYKGLTLQATYRLGSRVDLGGNYTLSRAWGNSDGESPAAGPGATRLLSYPEYIQSSWFSPEGDLSIDQRHRMHAWGIYQVPMPSEASSLSISLLHQYGSGVPYGAIGGVNTIPFVVNPGYVAPAGNRTATTWDYYFTSRDAFRTEASNRTDLAINYAHAIRAAGSVEVFFHGDVLNIFNVFQLCGCGDTVFKNGGTTNLSKINQGVVSPGTSGMQTFNPFTTTPVKGVNWNTAANFGTAVDRFAYTTPRTFRFSFGVRF
jgi:Carboxypeptidase regulatory-like domain/TonB dependent receptor-like, beta-barrel